MNLLPQTPESCRTSVTELFCTGLATSNRITAIRTTCSLSTRAPWSGSSSLARSTTRRIRRLRTESSASPMPATILACVARSDLSREAVFGSFVASSTGSLTLNIAIPSSSPLTSVKTTSIRAMLTHSALITSDTPIVPAKMVMKAMDIPANKLLCPAHPRLSQQVRRPQKLALERIKLIESYLQYHYCSS